MVTKMVTKIIFLEAVEGTDPELTDQETPLDYVGPYLVIIDRPHPSECGELNSILSNRAPNRQK